jgi:hypothetical protein
VAFDKQEYWALRGKPKKKTVSVQIIVCSRCKSPKGTLIGKMFYCLTPNCNPAPQPLPGAAA